MNPPFQSVQSIVVEAPIDIVWSFTQDLSRIPDFHPRVKAVSLISNNQFRAAGISYQCHLLDGKNSCVEKDIEIIPKEKIVTIFTADTMGLTKLLPDYLVETTFEQISDNATRINISHFYSLSGIKAWLLNWIIKPKIAHETIDTLKGIKRFIEKSDVTSL